MCSGLTFMSMPSVAGRDICNVHCIYHITRSVGYMQCTLYISFRRVIWYIQCTLYISRMDMYNVQSIYPLRKNISSPLTMYTRCNTEYTILSEERSRIICKTRCHWSTCNHSPLRIFSSTNDMYFRIPTNIRQLHVYVTHTHTHTYTHTHTHAHIHTRVGSGSVSWFTRSVTFSVSDT
jgi:hypothetical protein